jgi:Tol biopolymer transport system component
LLQLDPNGLSKEVTELIRPPTDLAAPTVGKDNRTVVAIATRIQNDKYADPPPSSNAVVLLDLHERRASQIAINVAAVATALSPDGRRLAVGGQGGEILLLDLPTGAPVRHAVVGHDGPAGPLAFSADGRTIVSGGRDGRVSVWDGHTGERLGALTVTAAPDVSTHPAFLPDGHTVVIVASDGAIHTWDTDVRLWTAYACEVVGRDMTGTEWSEAVGKRPYQRTCHT